jgi:hypothetical protein
MLYIPLKASNKEHAKLVAAIALYFVDAQMSIFVGLMVS